MSAETARIVMVLLMVAIMLLVAAIAIGVLALRGERP